MIIKYYPYITNQNVLLYQTKLTYIHNQTEKIVQLKRVMKECTETFKNTSKNKEYHYPLENSEGIIHHNQVNFIINFIFAKLTNLGYLDPSIVQWTVGNLNLCFLMKDSQILKK